MQSLSTIPHRARPRRWLALLLATWLGALCKPGLAVAEAVDPATLERASHIFDRGVAFAQDGSYEQAVIAFEQAHALSRSPAVLYNLGMAYVATGRPVEASDALARYLEHEGAALDEAERTRIREELERQRERVGTVVLDVQPAAARIVIDGRLRAPADQHPVRLALGDHWLEVSAPGHETSVTTFRVTGEPQIWAVRLRSPAALAQATQREAAESGASERTLEPQTRSRLRLAGYGLGIAGVLSGLSALTVYLVGDARHGDWKREERELAMLEASLANWSNSAEISAYNQRVEDNNDRWRGIRRMDKAAMGLAIGGGALLAAGVALVVWIARADAQPRARKATLKPAGLGLLATF